MGNDPKQCTFYPIYWVTPIRMSSLDINNESIRANFFFASNHKKEYKKKNGKSKEKKNDHKLEIVDRFTNKIKVIKYLTTINFVPDCVRI